MSWVCRSKGSGKLEEGLEEGIEGQEELREGSSKMSTDVCRRPGTKRQWPLDMRRVEGRGLCSGCSGRAVNENQESV